MAKKVTKKTPPKPSADYRGKGNPGPQPFPPFTKKKKGK